MSDNICTAPLREPRPCVHACHACSTSHIPPHPRYQSSSRLGFLSYNGFLSSLLGLLYGILHSSSRFAYRKVSEISFFRAFSLEALEWPLWHHVSFRVKKNSMSRYGCGELGVGLHETNSLPYSFGTKPSILNPRPW